MQNLEWINVEILTKYVKLGKLIIFLAIKDVTVFVKSKCP